MGHFISHPPSPHSGVVFLHTLFSIILFSDRFFCCRLHTALCLSHFSHPLHHNRQPAMGHCIHPANSSSSFIFIVILCGLFHRPSSVTTSLSLIISIHPLAPTISWSKTLWWAPTKNGTYLWFSGRQNNVTTNHDFCLRDFQWAWQNNNLHGGHMPTLLFYKCSKGTHTPKIQKTWQYSTGPDNFCCRRYLALDLHCGFSVPIRCQLCHSYLTVP